MGAFTGIYQRDGAILTESTLRLLAAGLGTTARRWHHGCAAFVAAGDAQLESLDGNVHFVGNVRLDDRLSLLEQLRAADATATAGEPDGQLVLRAYRAWGEAALSRLHGDFAFAIWDERAQRMLCGRDHFGIKPFFHATGPDLFAFASALPLVRSHPAVSPQIDESFIADFLIFGQQQDPAASVFTGVRRLPGGHFLEVGSTACRSGAHSKLPAGPYLRYRNAEQYIEHFGQVLAAAVHDRVGTTSAVLQLSGGLDSACIGGVLAGKLGSLPQPVRAGAVCIGWEKYFADPEPQLARESAGALGLPIEIWQRTDCDPFLQVHGPAPAEPSFVLFQGALQREQRELSTRAPVILNGQGGDEIFFRELLFDELRATGNLRLIPDALGSWRAYGRPPIGLRETIGGILGRRQRFRPFRMPEWIHPAWSRALGLEERVLAYTRKWALPPRQSRASARERLANTLWQSVAEEVDASNTGVAAEVRWPFLDWRVVSFALSVPPYPWCVNRALLRKAISAWAPPRIRDRPKTPLRVDPLVLHLQSTADWRKQYLDLPVPLQAWIDAGRWRSTCEQYEPDPATGDTAWSLSRVAALSSWLSQSGDTAAPRLS